MDNRFRTGGGLAALHEIAPHDSDLKGRVLGDYRIIELIAEGGMSHVYRAERIDGSFEREVAVKVSTASSFHRVLSEHFQRETAVLAGLNHPNIAQLFDARTTEEGWPYIVMELVSGGPIDEYCHAANLDSESRVRLFIQVVDAVAMAHSRMIVHRDIKPSNVLVDDSGRPKLLDFGIAKMIEASDEGDTSIPMTPRYASPEQLLHESVGAASDVYQLGLLLHQILVRPEPEDADAHSQVFRNAARGKSVRVCDSARRLVPRDLVSIIEKCLCAVPSDRYRDATSLGDDLRAYLDGFPVQAAGRGTMYRVGKLIARQKLASAVMLTALTLLIAGSTWYTLKLTEARDSALKSQAESEAVLNFVVDMLGSANPNAHGEDYRVADALDAAAFRLEEDFANSPSVRARIHDVVGDTFRSLGREEDAEVQHRARLKIYDELGVEGGPGRTDALLDLVWLSRERGDYERAFELGEEAIEAARNSYGEGRLEVAYALREHANSHVHFGDVDAALPFLETAVAIYEHTSEQTTEIRRATLATSARYSSLSGDYEQAIGLYEELYAIDLEVYGEGHTESLVTLGHLSNAYLRAGKPDLAEAGRRQQLSIMRRVLGERHPYTLITMITLATTMESSGPDFEEQEDLIVSAIEGYLSHGDPEHSRIATARYTLGTLYRLHGRYADAVRTHTENLPDLQSLYGSEAPLTLYAMGDLASSLCRDGRPAEAQAYFDRFFEKAPDVIGEDHRITRMYESEYTWCRQNSPPVSPRSGTERSEDRTDLPGA